MCKDTEDANPSTMSSSTTNRYDLSTVEDAFTYGEFIEKMSPTYITQNPLERCSFKFPNTMISKSFRRDQTGRFCLARAAVGPKPIYPDRFYADGKVAMCYPRGNGVPALNELRDSVKDEVGNVIKFIITSFEPGARPVDYFGYASVLQHQFEVEGSEHAYYLVQLVQDQSAN